ncbi:MAG: pyridoxal-phosphate dependent enzyme [Gammaproteobacteria bacterium]|nr:pyridoxal-phosphate dependent enzyme [Gammaproteobacteria bacterium]
MLDHGFSANAAVGRLEDLPRARLVNGITPLEAMPNLSRVCGGARLYVKRDDAMGFAFGGNKVRQLEFYLGEALNLNSDTILITGAVQSNFVRLAAAAANKLGMECHIQLEERVPKEDDYYRHSGNVFLDQLLGATLHSYPEGEDEVGADLRLGEIAQELSDKGKNPYVIPLGPGHAPLGALGYVIAAQELLNQIKEYDLSFDQVIVPSGSGNTHGGLLFGLRALGSELKVRGICIRRNTEIQFPRIRRRCEDIATLLQVKNMVADHDVILDDQFLAPGYGLMSSATVEGILWGARYEALMLDPTYSGKAMSACIEYARKSDPDSSILFWHTGGTPGLFAYQNDLSREFAKQSQDRI